MIRERLQSLLSAVTDDNNVPFDTAVAVVLRELAEIVKDDIGNGGDDEGLSDLFGTLRILADAYGAPRID